MENTGKYSRKKFDLKSHTWRYCLCLHMGMNLEVWDPFCMIESTPWPEHLQHLEIHWFKAAFHSFCQLQSYQKLLPRLPRPLFILYMYLFYINNYSIFIYLYILYKCFLFWHSSIQLWSKSEAFKQFIKLIILAGMTILVWTSFFWPSFFVLFG